MLYDDDGDLAGCHYYLPVRHCQILSTCHSASLSFPMQYSGTLLQKGQVHLNFLGIDLSWSLF